MLNRIIGEKGAISVHRTLKKGKIVKGKSETYSQYTGTKIVDRKRE